MPIVKRGSFRDRHRCSMPTGGEIGDVYQCDDSRCECLWRKERYSEWQLLEGLDRWLVLWQTRRERKAR